MKVAIELYTQIVVAAIPFGVVFALGNMVVKTLFNLCFPRQFEIGV